MKQCILGIGILLFAIMLELCSTGMSFLSLIVGLLGLIILLVSAFEKR